MSEALDRIRDANRKRAAEAAAKAANLGVTHQKPNQTIFVQSEQGINKTTGETVTVVKGHTVEPKKQPASPPTIPPTEVKVQYEHVRVEDSNGTQVKSSTTIVTASKQDKKYPYALGKSQYKSEDIIGAIKKLKKDGVADYTGKSIENLTEAETQTVADQIRVMKEDPVTERETQDTQQKEIRKAAKIAKKERARKEQEEIADLARQRAKEDNELYLYKQNYICGPQIGIFIGDRWVDNAVSIEYTKTVNKTPVYGYASEFYAAVAKGTVIVNGTLNIAYTNDMYLSSILNKFYKDNNDLNDIIQQEDTIQRLKTLYWNNVEEDTVVIDPLRRDYPEKQKEGDGYATKGFDIQVVFGIYDYVTHHIYRDQSGKVDFSLSSPIEIIRDVHLTSRSVVVTPTGEPIGETFTFFAKNVEPFQRKAKITAANEATK